MTENAFRPFCSDRCRFIDLGHWISGTYRIPESAASADEEEEPPSRKDPEKR